MKKIDKLRNETYNDLVDKLNKHGKCALIRPTGFGKTGILTRLLQNYKNIVYLYPTGVIKDTVLNFNVSLSDDIKHIENVTFITYYKLCKMSRDDMKELGEVDLIICDECHRLGAVNTYKAINQLISIFPNVHFVGATATPDRMDLVDEISDFFDNIVVSEYTLHNAFKDGVLKRPYYCFCSYGVEDLTNVEKETKLEIEKMDNDRANAEVLLRSRLIEISNLQRMDNIIRETCSQYTEDDNYLKFIVFFSNFKHLHDKGKDVECWFNKAYTEYSINILNISSETEEFRDNIENLSKLTYKEKHIDLIYCVDMMNMGYHVNDLTGIIMYRGTESGIIFSQQLGRALSSGSNKACIVFDVVDNIHREAMYDVLGHKSKEAKAKQRKLTKLLKKQEEGIELTESEEIELEKLQSSLSATKSKWWTHANDLLPEDLIATGHEATYRELIAKTVAEPISMRCRQAWKRWLERGGSDTPFTREHVLSQKSPNAVPLSPFCELKNVSINAVLKEMGL